MNSRRHKFVFAAAAVGAVVTLHVVPVFGQSLAAFREEWYSFNPGAPFGTGTDPYAPETLSFDESYTFPYSYDNVQWDNTVRTTGTTGTFGGKRPGVVVAVSASASGPTDLAIGSNNNTRAIVTADTKYEIYVRPLAGASVTRDVPLQVLEKRAVLTAIVGYGYADSVCNISYTWSGATASNPFHACQSGMIGSSLSCASTLPFASYRGLSGLLVEVAPDRATILTVELQCRLEVAAEVWNNQGQGVASATGVVDPVVYVDPTWPFAADYELTFSPNGIEPTGVPGDCDGYTGVDLADYHLGAGCVGGPSETAVEGSCACFDIDGDGDVDLSDFADVQLTFTGTLP